MAVPDFNVLFFASFLSVIKRGFFSRINLYSSSGSISSGLNCTPAKMGARTGKMARHINQQVTPFFVDLMEGFIIIWKLTNAEDIKIVSDSL